jgi:hypothetical protein
MFLFSTLPPTLLHILQDQAARSNAYEMLTLDETLRRLDDDAMEVTL